MALRRKLLKGPDPYLVRDQLSHLQNLLKVYGAEVFCRYAFWILRKTPEKGEQSALPKTYWNKRLVPWWFNRVQQDIENRKKLRNIYLKFRQGGYTTYMINRMLYLPAITEPGAGCLLISQTNSYANAHFLILKRTHRHVFAEDPYNSLLNDFSNQLHDNLLHTAYSNRRELVFDQLDSRIVCESSEVEEAGQGLTLTHLAGTEVARWKKKPEETLANAKEALAPGGTVDLESTANGLGGYFYEECMRARDVNNHDAEFQYFFHQWWWNEEYRDAKPIKKEELSDRDRELMRQFQIDLYQMHWKKKKVISLRHNFAEKYPEDDITAFLTTGHNFFDTHILQQRLLELQSYKPLARHRDGDLVVFHRRIRGRKYIIGADPAQGIQVTNEDTDFSAAVVIDEETGEEMASLRLRCPPEDFAADLEQLGRAYNGAMIAVERTGDGGSVILALVHARYNNIYKHKEWHKRDRQVVLVEGFPTNRFTRPVALNKLAAFVREFPEKIHDKVFVEEALKFIRIDPRVTRTNTRKPGSPQGAPGSHDDTVSARWIAHLVRLVNLNYWDPIEAPSEQYGEDAEDAAA